MRRGGRLDEAGWCVSIPGMVKEDVLPQVLVGLESGQDGGRNSWIGRGGRGSPEAGSQIYSMEGL